MNFYTCCFVGHKSFPARYLPTLLMHLYQKIENCIKEGISTFISGGEKGFDQLAASLIIAKKEMGHKIQLHFVLPDKKQESLWHKEEKHFYHALLKQADKISYISSEKCLCPSKNLTDYILDHSNYCICAFLNEDSQTQNAVRYAYRQGLIVRNIAKI